jgi:hypothetical protein
VYGIKDFEYYMNEFFHDYFPDRTLTLSPDDRITVFPKATQIINDAFVTDLVDRMHASPEKPSQTALGAKFDTVLIRKTMPGRIPEQLTYGMSSKPLGLHAYFYNY